MYSSTLSLTSTLDGVGDQCHAQADLPPGKTRYPLYGGGARGGVVVKALRYKPAGRGFDSRWCHWNFSVT